METWIDEKYPCQEMLMSSSLPIQAPDPSGKISCRRFYTFRSSGSSAIGAGPCTKSGLPGFFQQPKIMMAGTRNMTKCRNFIDSAKKGLYYMKIMSKFNPKSAL
jgi:hypothetical protein